MNTSSDIARLVRIKQPFTEVVQLIPRIMGLLVPYYKLRISDKQIQVK